LIEAEDMTNGLAIGDDRALRDPVVAQQSIPVIVEGCAIRGISGSERGHA
jgi:hypothetical protein